MRATIPTLAVAMLLVLSATSNAANYTKTITVAKKGGNFSSPVEALASVTGASAKAPVLVKMLPGNYDLGEASLQMKEYVDVEGAGSDKTSLTAMTANAENNGCNAGVVKMANNSVIRNIRIVNRAPDSASGLCIGIVFNNVKARADNIRVEVGNDKDSSLDNAGICATGAESLATIDNADVEVRTGTGVSASAAILHEDGSMNIAGSRLAAFASTGGITRVVDCTKGIKYTGMFTIDNSQVQGTIAGVSGVNRGIDVYDCKAIITNSTIKLTGGEENHGVVAGRPEISIRSSRIYSPGNAILGDEESSVKASDNLLQGNITNLKGVSLKGNYDENKVPIADR